MSLEPQPGHSSRTVAVAVLLLAVFLMVTFYKGRRGSVSRGFKYTGCVQHKPCRSKHRCCRCWTRSQ